MPFWVHESYNPHPQTGMISVSEAFELVRRWNAKECYIVHYRGLLDFEEATNQWFRGPVKAMTVDELQKVIDSHLQIVGKGGKFRMTVAKEGMVWDSKRLETKQEEEEEKATRIFHLKMLPSLLNLLRSKVCRIILSEWKRNIKLTN